MIAAISRDLHAAFRGLRRRPLFAAAVVGTLSLGIGANTAIFTVVHAVLLRALPFDDAGRLVAVHSKEPGSDREPFSIPDFEDLRAGARTADALVGYAGWTASLTGVDEPVTIPAQWATRGYFETLGIRPALGRTPRPEEERPGGSHVALLGDGLWRSRFGADPAILGRTLTLNGEPFTVIGVLPRDFVFLSAAARSSPRSSSRPTPGMRIAAPHSSASSPGSRRGEQPAGARRSRHGRGRPARKVSGHGRDEGGRAAPAARGARLGQLSPDALLPPGGGRRRAPHRLHESREPAARAHRRPPAGARPPVGARRGAGRPAAPAPDGDGAARARGRRARPRCRGGRRAAPARFRPRTAAARRDDRARRTRPRLQPRPLPRRRARLGRRTGAPRHARSGDDLRGPGAARAAARARARGACSSPPRSGSRSSSSSGRGFFCGRSTGSPPRAPDSGRPPARRPALPAEDALRHAGDRLSLRRRGHGAPRRAARRHRAAAASINPLTVWRATITFTIDGRADQDPAKAPLANYRAVGPGYFRRSASRSSPAATSRRAIRRRRFRSRS